MVQNIDEKKISTDKLDDLLKQATKVFKNNQKNIAWYGRCIFISWYCEIGTCKFCYRSTIKDRINHAKHAKRSIASILIEALLAKHLGWRIEFLTGGYGVFEISELVNIAKLVSEIYGEKIWLNLGALSKEELELFKPYVKGIVASIETANPTLHTSVCPDKPISKYTEMFEYAKDLKKSMTIIVGLGETKKDFTHLKKFIEKYNLDRITFYALKPIKDGPYKQGPSTEYYVWWVAKTRIEFPKIQIITGTTFRRIAETEPNTKDEALMLMKAGSNAITKFPITKKFNSPEAKKIESDIGSEREFIGTLTELPKIDWNKEIDNLKIDLEIKEKMKELMVYYLKRMS